MDSYIQLFYFFPTDLCIFQLNHTDWSVPLCGKHLEMIHSWSCLNVGKTRGSNRGKLSGTAVASSLRWANTWSVFFASLAALLGGTLEEIYIAGEKTPIFFLLNAGIFFNPGLVQDLRGNSDVHLSVVLFIPLILMKRCWSALSGGKGSLTSERLFEVHLVLEVIDPLSALFITQQMVIPKERG